MRVLKVAFVGIVLFLVVSMGTAVFSRVDSTAVPIEPEMGTLSSGATVQSDSTASGGKAVKFASVAIRNIDDKGYGIAASFVEMSPTEQDKMFQDLKDLGITWVRTDINWGAIQPNDATHYNWTAYDNAIAKANSYGIKVDGIIDYTSPWNRPTTGCVHTNVCRPANLSAYATFAQATVQHFGQKLGAVEIWNEPNLAGFWKPAANADDYSTLLKGAYAAIKSVDPGMLVLSAGLAPYGTTTIDGNIRASDFLTTMYQDGTKNSFDALAYHPYSYPVLPTQLKYYSGWSQMGSSQINPNIRSIMTANDDATKPIWITEVGAPTNGPSVTATCATAVANTYIGTMHQVDDCLQAEILSQAITNGRSHSWVGVIFLYTYKDASDTDTSTNENFFGLLNYDGSHKPSYCAVKQAIAQETLSTPVICP